MPNPITLTLPYPPSANLIWRTVQLKGWKHPRTILSKEGREYRKQVAKHVAVAGRPCLGTARLQADYQAYRPDRRRRDLDNIRKAVNDALEAAGVIDDDEQIDRDSGDKTLPIDRNNPRVVVTLTPIAGAEVQEVLSK